MSSNRSLQNNEDYVRCNLRVMKDSHPELFEHLQQIPDKGRAEQTRLLMRLGLMVLSGQLNGAAAAAVPMMPNMAAFMSQMHGSQSGPAAGSQAYLPADNGTSADKKLKEKPKDPNVVDLGESDVDFGDDLLFLD